MNIDLYLENLTNELTKVGLKRTGRTEEIADGIAHEVYDMKYPNRIGWAVILNKNAGVWTTGRVHAALKDVGIVAPSNFVTRHFLWNTATGEIERAWISDGSI